MKKLLHLLLMLFFLLPMATEAQTPKMFPSTPWFGTNMQTKTNASDIVDLLGIDAESLVSETRVNELIDEASKVDRTNGYSVALDLRGATHLGTSVYIGPSGQTNQSLTVYGILVNGVTNRLLILNSNGTNNMIGTWTVPHLVVSNSITGAGITNIPISSISNLTYLLSTKVNTTNASLRDSDGDLVFSTTTNTLSLFANNGNLLYASSLSNVIYNPSGSPLVNLYTTGLTNLLSGNWRIELAHGNGAGLTNLQVSGVSNLTSALAGKVDENSGVVTSLTFYGSSIIPNGSSLDFDGGGAASFLSGSSASFTAGGNADFNEGGFARFNGEADQAYALFETNSDIRFLNSSSAFLGGITNNGASALFTGNGFGLTNIQMSGISSLNSTLSNKVDELNGFSTNQTIINAVSIKATNYYYPNGIVAIASNNSLNYGDDTILTDSGGNLYYSSGDILADSTGYLYYGSGAYLADSAGSIYYANGNVLANVSGFLHYGSGNYLADSSGYLYYGDGGTYLADSAGNLFYGSGNTLADSSGAIYYGNGSTALASSSGELYYGSSYLLADSFNNLYYGNGANLADGGGALYHGDGSLLATNGNLYASSLTTTNGFLTTGVLVTNGAIVISTNLRTGPFNGNTLYLGDPPGTAGKTGVYLDNPPAASYALRASRSVDNNKLFYAEYNTGFGVRQLRLGSTANEGTSSGAVLSAQTPGLLTVAATNALFTGGITSTNAGVTTTISSNLLVQTGSTASATLGGVTMSNAVVILTSALLGGITVDLSGGAVRIVSGLVVAGNLTPNADNNANRNLGTASAKWYSAVLGSGGVTSLGNITTSSNLIATNTITAKTNLVVEGWAIGASKVKYLTSDECLAAGASGYNDSSLLTINLPVGTYFIDCYAFTTGTDYATVGSNLGLAFSGTATMNGSAEWTAGAATDPTTVGATYGIASGNSLFQTSDAAGNCIVRQKGTLVVTVAGNLKWQAGTYVYDEFLNVCFGQGSFIKVDRIL